MSFHDLGWLAMHSTIILHSLLLLLFLLASTLLFSCLWRFWFRPRSLKRFLQCQGLTGPTPHFPTGCLVETAKIRKQLIQDDMGAVRHDILRQIIPEYFYWSKIYGKTFVHWMGVEPMCFTVEPDMLKQLSTLKFGSDKPHFLAKDRKPLFGNGLFTASGKAWQRQRRIVSPSFNIERINGMVNIMKNCAMNLLDVWAKAIDDAGGSTEIEVSDDLAVTTASILAQTTFGSKYETGKLVFDKLTELQFLLFQPSRFVGLPGARHLPTTTNRKVRMLGKEVDGLLREIVRHRRQTLTLERNFSFGNDLLGLMLAESEMASSKNHQDAITDQELADECKIFYFAGHETVFLSLSWTMLLLATNPYWQETARKEVQETLREKIGFDADVLSMMKTVQMIINESLRLYPPVQYTRRYASQPIQVGKLTFPRGASFCVPILALHHDADIWGEDVHKFNPERFRDGVAKACKQPYSYLPYGFGVRVCVGQNLAALEMKLLLSLILYRFKWSLSPKYRHSPIGVPTIRPKHGVQLIMEKVIQSSF